MVVCKARRLAVVLAVQDQVHIALLEVSHVLAAMATHRDKSELLEQMLELFRVSAGELDELEPHRCRGDCPMTESRYCGCVHA